MTSYIFLRVTIDFPMSKNTQKCLNNHCFVHLSMHYNKYFNWPIRTNSILMTSYGIENTSIELSGSTNS